MKVLKHCSIILVSTALIFLLAFLFLPKTKVTQHIECKTEPLVYVTKTGDCYHAAGCHYLQSRIEKGLDQAVSQGYRPCYYCCGDSTDYIEVEYVTYETVDITHVVLTWCLIGSCSAVPVIYILSLGLYTHIKRK